LIRETANYFQAQATLDAAVAASEFFREDLMEDSFACAMWGKGASGRQCHGFLAGRAKKAAMEVPESWLLGESEPLDMPGGERTASGQMPSCAHDPVDAEISPCRA
jgi:hypothetical protein